MKRCFFPLANENVIKFPKIAQIIKTVFFVDDLLTGAVELDQTAQICSGVSNVLKQGGFELREFYLNCNDTLKHVDSEDSNPNINDFSEYE